MANRVCLGERTTDEYGLYVSQSGVDVLTATGAQMVFSSDVPSFQFVQTGHLSVSSGGTNLAIPDLGYYPFIVFFPKITDSSPDALANSFADIGLVYNSHTSVTLYLSSNMDDDGTLTYGITRIPITGV